MVDFGIAATWVASGFGPLNEVRPALFALVAMLLGLQTVFSSFFLFAIELQVRDPRGLNPLVGARYLPAGAATAIRAARSRMTFEAALSG